MSFIATKIGTQAPAYIVGFTHLFCLWFCWKFAWRIAYRKCTACDGTDHGIQFGPILIGWKVP